MMTRELFPDRDVLPDDRDAAQAVLIAFSRHGLPSVQFGMSLQEVMAVLIDFLVDNDLVKRCRFERADDHYACFFDTCPFYGNCPLPTDHCQAHQLLCKLTRNTLARAGHPMDVFIADAKEGGTNVSFLLQTRSNADSAILEQK